jgi:hypothetical protein
MLDAEQDYARATRTEYSREYSFLHANHLGLIKDSAISPEVSRERGYRTVTTQSALKRYGFADLQCRVPALLIPVWNVRGQLVSYQVRPDEPRIDAITGPVEYERCAGQRLLIDVPPSCRERLADPGVTLHLTDAVRKADSAAAQGLSCIALLGLSSWLLQK